MVFGQFEDAGRLGFTDPVALTEFEVDSHSHNAAPGEEPVVGRADLRR